MKHQVKYYDLLDPEFDSIFVSDTSTREYDFDGRKRKCMWSDEIPPREEDLVDMCPDKRLNRMNVWFIK